MLKYLFYPIFGGSVLAAYVAVALSGADTGSVTPSRRQLPAMAGPGPMGYAAAPIIWYTGFHGPARYTPSGSSGSSGSTTYVGGGTGSGSHGGYSGGK